MTSRTFVSSARSLLRMPNRFVRLILALSIITLLLTLNVVVVLPQNAFSQQIENENTGCNCVVFRMDDIQDYWMQSGQLTPMNLFSTKNQSLSLGLVLNLLGNDSKLVETIRYGANMGLFELAIHGWEHVDYTQFAEQAQKNTLKKANEKLDVLFGNKSNIFIPPYNAFNNSTLESMKQVGLEIISAANWMEEEIDQKISVYKSDRKTNNKGQHEITHLPETISFTEYYQDKPFPQSTKNIIANVTQNIEEYGYAVIVFHPQDFVKIGPDGNFTNILDANRINDLSLLIDSFSKRNIDITSFSDIAAIEPRIYYPFTPSCSSPYYRNVSRSDLSLRVSDPIPVMSLRDQPLQCSLGEIYNLYGKYLYSKSSELGTSSSIAAAVLFVESLGSGFGSVDGRMIIRFEACAFYDTWGKIHSKEFSDYFLCDVPDDKFRISPQDKFAEYHGNQSKEWAAFEFARNLDEESALKSISMGIGQIMGYNYDKIGYGSVEEMFNEMSTGTRPQLDGFFAFLKYKNYRGESCLQPLKNESYIEFARCYNAAGMDEYYGSKLQEAVKVYNQVTIGRSNI